MNPRHLSLSTEHYTPPDIIEAAREVMGGIDLDPASSDIGAAHVKPGAYFTEADDGFKQAWWGRVFLNPPGGKSDDQQRRVLSKCSETGECGLPIGHEHHGVESSQKKWWFKLAKEYQEGRVKQAIFIGFSIEILQVTQVIKFPSHHYNIPLDYPFCIPSERLKYWKVKIPAGRITAPPKLVPSTSPPHASVVIYLGPRQERFGDVFLKFGRCVTP